MLPCAPRPVSPRHGPLRAIPVLRSNSPESYRTLSPTRSLVAVPVVNTLHHSVQRAAILHAPLAPRAAPRTEAVGPYTAGGSVSQAARAAVPSRGVVLTPRGPPLHRLPASAPAAPISPQRGPGGSGGAAILNGGSPRAVARVLVTNGSGGHLFQADRGDSEDSLARQLRALKEAKLRAASELAKSEKQIARRQDQLRRETVQALQATPRLADALKRWPSPSPPMGGAPAVETAPCAEPRVHELVAMSEATPIAVATPREEEEELPGDSSTLLLPAESVAAAPVAPAPAAPVAPPPSPPLTQVAHERLPRPAVMSERNGAAPTAHGRCNGAGAGALLKRPPGDCPGSEIQAELKRLRAVLQSAAQQVTLSDLRQLRQLRRPPPGVVRTCEFVSILLGEREGKTVNFKKLLADTLPARLSAFEAHSITHAMKTQLRTLGTLTDGGCEPCAALTRWCSCIRAYLDDSGGRGSPRRTEESSDAAVERGSTPPAKATTTTTTTTTTTAAPVNGTGESLVVSPDLRSLSPEELRKVENLTITRRDVASVVFHGLTDCTDLDLEKDVLLKRGYVLVYPDAKRKPPKGTGLNKRATVTMFQCFPPGGPVETEDQAQEYRDKIKEMTEENSACRFIDYDCDSGIWRFEVERF